MASRKKKATKRVLTAAQKRKYRLARKRRQAEMAEAVDMVHGVSLEPASEKPLTPSQRAEIAEGMRDAAYAEINELRERLRDSVPMETFSKERDAWAQRDQNKSAEIGQLRNLLDRIVHGGVQIDAVRRV